MVDLGLTVFWGAKMKEHITYKNSESIKESVRDYYGRVLKSKDDLKSTACCAAESFPAHIKPIAALVHPEILERFYGCGVPVPAAIEGCTILDLGCGTGRDAYILSRLTGPTGRVIGLDMTDAQLELARKHQEYHRQQFGYPRSNVDFRKGYIEDLAAADIADESIDLVVSNCVINLSPDKKSVFSEIFRVLRPGGELYFSDVFCDRRLSEEQREDPVLLGECLGGAMYKEDFRRLMTDLGCPDFRIISATEIGSHNEEVQRKIGLARFFSITIRAFKLPLEDRCEDYGQVAYYLGGIPESPHAFRLDDHHLLEKGRAFPVCANTAAMLTKSRFKHFFKVEGDTSIHFGIFPCGPAPSVAEGSPAAGACC